MYHGRGKSVEVRGPSIVKLNQLGGQGWMDVYLGLGLGRQLHGAAKQKRESRKIMSEANLEKKRTRERRNRKNEPKRGRAPKRDRRAKTKPKGSQKEARRKPEGSQREKYKGKLEGSELNQQARGYLYLLMLAPWLPSA